MNSGDGTGRTDKRLSAPVPKEIYRERAERFAREHDLLTQRWNRLANVRLVAFVAAAFCLGWAIRERAPVIGGIGAILFAGFLVLVSHHRQLGRLRRRAGILLEINREAGDRVNRAWDSLPLRSTARAEPGHPYAADLDLFGRASLMHLLDPVFTPMGEHTLTCWLVAPTSPVQVRARQVAVADLAPMLELRQELSLRGRLMEGVGPDTAPFLAWAEGESWLATRPALRWVSRLSPLLLGGLLVANLTGLFAAPLWIGFLILNFAISQTVGRAAYQLLTGVASQEGAFRHYAALMEAVSSASFSAPDLRRLQANLTTGDQPAHRHVERLHRLASLVIPQSAILYLIFQAITLWDFHVLAALERWQSVAGKQARQWLAAVGEAEALSSLAGLAHDNPSWVFPDLDPAASTVDARALGHPLLSETVRVTNDVAIGPAGTFLLVTGSNMSGKSTLLRAIGTNVVLAGAGAPVCAAACRLPPVALWTAMRIEDSLERGVSYFMAELQRLKQIVEAARASHHSGDRRLLYLLDELLQGTNTVERQVAARRIIRHLLAQDAIGAVSTHDLSLAEAPDLIASAHLVHFVETIAPDGAGPGMSFDYTLRPGIATSTNALRLMELVGLGEEPGDGGRGSAEARP